MDKITYRIVSKFGLLMVIIGFFMPISCNLNGFQIAKTVETFGGPNILSISLYGIFIFACLGLFFLLLQVLKKPLDIKFEWINVSIIMALFIFAVFIQIAESEDPFLRLFLRLQSGAYVILIGLIINVVFLALSSKDKVQTVNTEENDMKETNNKLPSAEKQIFLLLQKKGRLNNFQIIEKTNLEIEEVEKALEKLQEKN